MISVMKPCVLPDLADNTSTRQNRQFVRCIFLRDECGSFRPTLAMAEQEIGNRTFVSETLVLDDGTSHDSGTGKLGQSQSSSAGESGEGDSGITRLVVQKRMSI